MSRARVTQAESIAAMPAAIGDRTQSLGEELANAITHGLALLLTIAATPVLILAAIDQGDATFVAAVSLFCATAVFLYLASTLYHALPGGAAKRLFWVLDHAGIFLLIAGTYTPFTLGAVREAWGWPMFGAVWGLAGAGILLKVVGARLPDFLSTGLYLALGWIVLVAIGPLIAAVPATGLAWLVAGGLFYTGGVLFFSFDARLKYAHAVWHLFVMAGTACHFVAVFGYAA